MATEGLLHFPAGARLTEGEQKGSYRTGLRGPSQKRHAQDCSLYVVFWLRTEWVWLFAGVGVRERIIVDGDNVKAQGVKTYEVL